MSLGIGLGLARRALSWILATGLWDDDSFWRDSQYWKD